MIWRSSSIRLVLVTVTITLFPFSICKDLKLPSKTADDDISLQQPLISIRNNMRSNFTKILRRVESDLENLIEVVHQNDFAIDHHKPTRSVSQNLEEDPQKLPLGLISSTEISKQNLLKSNFKSDQSTILFNRPKNNLHTNDSIDHHIDNTDSTNLINKNEMQELLLDNVGDLYGGGANEKILVSLRKDSKLRENSDNLYSYDEINSDGSMEKSAENQIKTNVTTDLKPGPLDNKNTSVNLQAGNDSVVKYEKQNETTQNISTTSTPSLNFISTLVLTTKTTTTTDSFLNEIMKNIPIHLSNLSSIPGFTQIVDLNIVGNYTSINSSLTQLSPIPQTVINAPIYMNIFYGTKPSNYSFIGLPKGLPPQCYTTTEAPQSPTTCQMAPKNCSEDVPFFRRVHHHPEEDDTMLRKTITPTMYTTKDTDTPGRIMDVISRGSVSSSKSLATESSTGTLPKVSENPATVMCTVATEVLKNKSGVEPKTTLFADTTTSASTKLLTAPEASLCVSSTLQNGATNNESPATNIPPVALNMIVMAASSGNATSSTETITTVNVSENTAATSDNALKIITESTRDEASSDKMLQTSLKTQPDSNSSETLYTVCNTVVEHPLECTSTEMPSSLLSAPPDKSTIITENNVALIQVTKLPEPDTLRTVTGNESILSTASSEPTRNFTLTINTTTQTVESSRNFTQIFTNSNSNYKVDEQVTHPKNNTLASPVQQINESIENVLSKSDKIIENYLIKSNASDPLLNGLFNTNDNKSDFSSIINNDFINSDQSKTKEIYNKVINTSNKNQTHLNSLYNTSNFDHEILKRIQNKEPYDKNHPPLASQNLTQQKVSKVKSVTEWVSIITTIRSTNLDLYRWQTRLPQINVRKNYNSFRENKNNENNEFVYHTLNFTNELYGKKNSSLKTDEKEDKNATSVASKIHDEINGKYMNISKTLKNNFDNFHIGKYVHNPVDKSFNSQLELDNKKNSSNIAQFKGNKIYQTQNISMLNSAVTENPLYNAYSPKIESIIDKKIEFKGTLETSLGKNSLPDLLDAEKPLNISNTTKTKNITETEKHHNAEDVIHASKLFPKAENYLHFKPYKGLENGTEIKRIHNNNAVPQQHNSAPLDTFIHDISSSNEGSKKFFSKINESGFIKTDHNTSEKEHSVPNNIFHIIKNDSNTNFSLTNRKEYPESNGAMNLNATFEMNNKNILHNQNYSSWIGRNSIKKNEKPYEPSKTNQEASVKIIKNSNFMKFATTSNPEDSVLHPQNRGDIALTHNNREFQSLTENMFHNSIVTETPGGLMYNTLNFNSPEKSYSNIINSNNINKKFNLSALGTNNNDGSHIKPVTANLKDYSNANFVDEKTPNPNYSATNINDLPNTLVHNIIQGLMEKLKKNSTEFITHTTPYTNTRILNIEFPTSLAENFTKNNYKYEKINDKSSLLLKSKGKLSLQRLNANGNNCVEMANSLHSYGNSSLNIVDVIRN